MSYLSDLINDHKSIRNESNEWKIQLNMGVNFVSSNDTGEIHTFCVHSDNEEIINELFKSFLSNYQEEENILREIFYLEVLIYWPIIFIEQD